MLTRVKIVATAEIDLRPEEIDYLKTHPSDLAEQLVVALDCDDSSTLTMRDENGNVLAES